MTYQLAINCHYIWRDQYDGQFLTDRHMLKWYEKPYKKISPHPPIIDKAEW
jgi:hypothetical protein